MVEETPALDPITDVVYPEQDLQNVETSQQHPADREPTDEEVERAAYIGGEFPTYMRDALKAWQQVWREQQ